MVPAGESSSRRAPDETGYRISLSLEGRCQWLVDPVHRSNRRGDRVGRFRFHTRSDRRLDLLAREDPAHRLARTRASRARYPVGEARLLAARRRRERPATHANAQQLLRVHLAVLTGYLAGSPDEGWATLLLQRLRTLPHV